MIKNDFINSENEKRFVNIAKEPIFIVVNDTFEDEVLVDDGVVDCLNALYEENRGIQEKVFELMDYLEKEKGINRKEIKEWWNDRER